jgi:catechol 2,3-dioxygenase-like lactoylglutathione lyase family enzyme
MLDSARLYKVVVIMKVLGLSWLGIRTADFEKTAELLRDVMGLEVIRDDPTTAGFRLNSRTSMEVYRLEDPDHAFFTTGPVVAFLVDDADLARAQMEAADIEFIGEMQRSATAQWNHFRLPDGTVCEIMSRHASE